LTGYFVTIVTIQFAKTIIFADLILQSRKFLPVPGKRIPILGSVPPGRNYPVAGATGGGWVVDTDGYLSMGRKAGIYITF